MDPELSQYCVPPGESLRRVMDLLDTSGKGIALVVDEDGRLLGTLTDGDLRRAMLAGLGLETPAGELASHKPHNLPSIGVTAPHDAEPAQLLKLIKKHGVRQVPLIDAEGRVRGLVTQDDLLPAQDLPLQAVIMAGGFGKRMHPLTQQCPKPLLPIGDQPLMARTLGQLRQSGIRRVSVSTHYLAEQIRAYCGDGSQFDLELSYLSEERPLGTAGALSLIDQPAEPLLIINGDILTNVNFRAMLDFHREQQARLTLAVRKYDVAVPYGVVETNGARVERVVEKPVLNFFVNAGIYLLEASACALVPPGRRCDMTELIQILVERGERVVSFPVIEYWLDVGTPSDYERAQTDYSNGRLA